MVELFAEEGAKVVVSDVNEAGGAETVDLIEADPARRVKLKIAYEGLSKMHPADIADIVEDLAPAEREAVFETIDEGVAAETLEELLSDRRNRFFSAYMVKAKQKMKIEVNRESLQRAAS